MIVTINTDASYSQRFKVAAFAFWIVCDQGKIMHSGPLKNAKNSTEAELMCICNALHVLLKSKFTDVTKVIINCDSIHVMAYSEKRNHQKGHAANGLSSLMTSLVNKYYLKRGWFDFRHVKGHSGTEEKRKWVNDWCDQKAKEQLSLLINKKTNT